MSAQPVTENLPAPSSTGPGARLRSIAPLVAIVLIGAGLRLWRLDAVPPGINQDEAVHAYDAWCLLKTGRDHDGASWPIFFRAFGDYHPGPYVYTIIPFEAVLGLRVLAARLPAALIGIAGVPLAYLLVRKRYGNSAGLLAAALLAISPWHVHLSRLAFEAGTCPTLLLLGYVLLQSAHLSQPAASLRGSSRARQLLMLLTAGLVFGLTTWTYHAMRLVVPALLIVTLWLYRRQARQLLQTPSARVSVFAVTGGLLIGLTPFLAATIHAPEQVWARAAAVVSGSGDQSIAAAGLTLLKNYASHFSPTFLFFHGDQSEIQSVPNYGQAHFLAMALLPLGIIHILRNWRDNRFGRLLLAWLLIGPVPAAFTNWHGGHALRGVGMLPALELISALGALQLIDFARKHSQSSMRVSTAALVGLMLVSAGLFCRRFFVEYPIKSAPAFQSEWADAFAEVKEKQDDYDLVLLSPDRSNQLGMLYLFWAQMDPAAYQKGDKDIEQLIGIERITRIGKVVFRPSTYLPILGPQLPPCARVLVVERPDVPVAGVKLKSFHLPDGREALVMYDLTSKDIPSASPCPQGAAR
ncbi:hypothetical protein B7486_15300 [cyanobacterium TDX16]|nr:hypothetical protein B7486_15300 [cyanobacterium TDX16]